MEEWISYNRYERPAPTIVTSLSISNTLGQHRLRPLQDTTTAFAHGLTRIPSSA